jgi:hypothetical protein
MAAPSLSTVFTDHNRAGGSVCCDRTGTTFAFGRPDALDGLAGSVCTAVPFDTEGELADTTVDIVGRSDALDGLDSCVSTFAIVGEESAQL